MFLATINKGKRLLYLHFIGHVRLEELERARADMLSLVAELPSGFRLVTDLSPLHTMDVECGTEITRMMDLFAEKGTSVVIRVIPEPDKDIGFNILSVFHYEKNVRTFTYASLEEAERLLSE